MLVLYCEISQVRALNLGPAKIFQPFANLELKIASAHIFYVGYDRMQKFPEIVSGAHLRS